LRRRVDRLLERLARRPGIYVPISTLVEEVWGDELTQKNTVQKTVANLRKCLSTVGMEALNIDGSECDHYVLRLP
jgi:DNA-binding winged helix-turn-helix (wHTH) protein